MLKYSHWHGSRYSLRRQSQLSTFSTGLGGEWYDNTVWTNNSPACGLSFAEIASADDVTIDNSFNLSTCTDPIYLSIRGSLLLTESNVSIDLPLILSLRLQECKNGYFTDGST